eukprot:GHVQ01040423.1.p1 GENE.GHVQ01040423.1~~GHVQ01040423.1.p1  ORF type:complete len:128 (+),score=14.15 GHVQ01040423.1:138-521(+)
MTDAATITAPTVMGRERREKSREVRSTGARNRTIKRMLIGGVLAYIIQLSFCVDHCVFPSCFIGVTAPSFSFYQSKTDPTITNEIVHSTGITSTNTIPSGVDLSYLYLLIPVPFVMAFLGKLRVSSG